MKRIIAALATFGFLASQAAEEKIPIESFFKLPQYAQMALSPDGKRIAATAPIGERQGLVVIDVENRKATPISGRSDRDIVNPRWINNRRILYSTVRLGERDLEQRGGGTFAVDFDGKQPRIISESGDPSESTESGRVTIRPLSVVRTLPGESDDVIAQETIFSPGEQPRSGPLYRLDTRTGRKTDISLGKPDSGAAEGWVVDRDGVARLFSASSPDEHTRRYYRSGTDAPWKKLDEDREVGGGLWRPVAMADDNKTVYVWSRKGRDKAAIYRFDPETNTMGEVVAQHPQVDLTSLVGDKDGIYGVRYFADQYGVAWFDEGFASTQSMVDKALPGKVNRLNWARDRNLFLITSFSDVAPPSFYLLDRKAGKMEWLGDSYPWIDAKKMSPMLAVRYPARDNMEIPAYLTVPRGSTGKSLPLVVMIHGGPWVAGYTWEWEPEVQFLASRGYAVLQPNFRGTLGYGRKHFTSSFFQWGLTMQDDITDGVAWAVAQGIADPKRVCIYGASYGGYAAMMGMAKTPEIFKCGINYVGVTDLPLLLTASWSDTFNSDSAQFSMKTRIGQVGPDSPRLKATSPVELADRIKAPVLLAYGGSDRRVVPQHGTRMKAALERAGNKPEWIIVDDEGHGFRDLKNQVMFYGAMERFLEKNIGGGP